MAIKSAIVNHVNFLKLCRCTEFTRHDIHRSIGILPQFPHPLARFRLFQQRLSQSQLLSRYLAHLESHQKVLYASLVLPRLRMNTRLLKIAFMRIRSPSNAPPVFCFVGSIDRIATFLSGSSWRNLRINSSVSELFPAPPVPVIPSTGVFLDNVRAFSITAFRLRIVLVVHFFRVRN